MHVRNWPRLLLMYWMKRERVRGQSKRSKDGGQGCGEKSTSVPCRNLPCISRSSFCHSCFLHPSDLQISINLYLKSNHCELIRNSSEELGEPTILTLIHVDNLGTFLSDQE